MIVSVTISILQNQSAKDCTYRLLKYSPPFFEYFLVISYFSDYIQYKF